MSEVEQKDAFAELSPIEFEDIVIKTLFKMPEIGSKVFPVLSRKSMQSPENGEIVEGVKDFHSTHQRYPSVREFHDLYLKSEDVKKKFRELYSVSLNSYKEEYLHAKIEEFVRIRLTFTKLVESATALKTTGDVNSIDNKVIEDFRKAVSFTIQSKAGISIKNDMGSFVEYLNKKNSFIPSHSPSLNYYIGGGYASKALTVWYGESNMGKTTFLCNDAAFAFTSGFDVLYISLEMDKQEIMKKIVANALEIPVRELSSYSQEFFEEGMRAISESDLKILEWPSFEVNSSEMLNAIQDLAVKENFRPHIIFLDYINCMAANRSQGGKKHEDLGFITKELENLSKELDVPIVTCSQFNRNAYGNSKPGAKDIGESIDIFKYSANGIAISRDPTMIAQNLYELTVIKNRYGPKDVSFLSKGTADIMKFRDATQNEVSSFKQSPDDEANEVIDGARRFPR